MVLPVPCRVMRASAAIRFVVGALNAAPFPPARKAELLLATGRGGAAGFAAIAEP